MTSSHFSSHLFMPSAFRRSLTRVLGFSPKDDLDLILPRFLPRTGDAVGDLLLANSVSCRLVTALEENSLFVRNKQIGIVFFPPNVVFILIWQ